MLSSPASSGQEISQTVASPERNEQPRSGAGSVSSIVAAALDLKDVYSPFSLGPGKGIPDVDILDSPEKSLLFSATMNRSTRPSISKKGNINFWAKQKK